MNYENRAQTEERLRRLKQEEQRLKLQLEVQKHASLYEVQVEWPATVSSSDPSRPLRTDDDIIQYRLMESGLLSDAPIKAGESYKAFDTFVKDLERTGCFNSVHVELAKSSNESTNSDGPPLTQAKVKLDESRWFRLHAGFGVKMDGWLKPETAVNDGFMPMGEGQTSIGLVNLTGCLDRTDFHYNIDTRAQTSLLLTHEQPLYRVLPDGLRNWLIEQDDGSQFSFRLKCMFDTLDFERTRSYKENNRMLSVSACNQHSFVSALQSPSLYYGIDWSLGLRNIVPRRHASKPYTMDASPEVVSQAGPSLKHSIKAEFRSNGHLLDHPYSPAGGVEAHATAELALPPGNVGFLKCDGGFGLHVPFFDRFSLHTIFNAGYLHSMSFGGICRPATLSDRYYVGGPLSMRGFVPAGIGPRTKNGGSSTPGGDAIGGDFYYTSTCMASVAPRSGIQTIDGLFNSLGLRIFTFASAGSCVGVMSHTPWQSVLRSSRITGGIGLTSTALGPRMELSYAWPLRYGPADARQHAQFGVGFSFS